MQNPEFVRSLLEAGPLTAKEYELLAEKYGGDDLRVLEHLASGTVADEKNMLGRLWGDSIKTAYVDLGTSLFQENVVQLLPERAAREHRAIPVYQFGGTVTIACATPTDHLVYTELERVMKRPLSMVFALPEDILWAIDIQYFSTAALRRYIDRISSHPIFKGADTITPEQLKQFASSQAVIEFSRGLLMLALKDRASDIHIEPGNETVRVRLRIDGVLQERLKLASALLAPVITRLKVLAKLDITEKRRPQDGRLSVRLPNAEYDLRFSTVPTIYGEKVVLRILGQSNYRDTPDLTDLGFAKQVLDQFMRIVEHPNGVFFVTGPTGSGKTTTLYSGLKYINKPGVNIMTVEDPVEIRLPGVNQVQVNHDIGLDFSSALRSFLRQDPDVILVGEIRDAETARIAAQAALTGHLVLSTMHTNSALQTISRLEEIGVESYMVAPSIIGVMAQRLVRRLCVNCKEPYRLEPGEIENLFEWDGETQVVFYRAKGCDQCGHTGYAGRIGIHEIFMINDEMRRLISRNAPFTEIQEYARRCGFRSMHYDGMKKVLRGITSLEEVSRVTMADGE